MSHHPGTDAQGRPLWDSSPLLCNLRTRTYRQLFMGVIEVVVCRPRRSLTSRVCIVGAALTVVAASGCTSGSGGSPAPTANRAAPPATSVTAIPDKQGIVAIRQSYVVASPGNSPAINLAVPKGEQAVDALGVEIFVPAELQLDPPCPGRSVNRPSYGLTYAIGCSGLEPPEVWIKSGREVIDGASPPRSIEHCLARPMLDGESGCVIQDPIEDATTIALAVIWPHHDVGIQAQVLNGRTAWAMRIFDSAHLAPIDRQGCTAIRSPVGLAPPPPTTTSSDVVPLDTASVSICWYSHHRLVASAEVTSALAISSIAHPTGVVNGPGITTPPSYIPQATAPTCTSLNQEEGVVFNAHAVGRPDSISTAQFADCRGTQQWTNGTASVPTGEPLASALRGSTGFLLTYGYQVTQQ